MRPEVSVRHVLARALLIVAGILEPAIGYAQQSTAGPSSTSVLLAGLHSANWEERANAYGQLRADKSALSRQDVRRSLLDLLDREDKLMQSGLRGRGAAVNVDDTYGEAFDIYVAELGETVASFADWTDSNQVCILVQQAFHPESPFAAKLATQGKVVADCLIQMYRNRSMGHFRSQAPPVLAEMLWARSQSRLDVATSRAARGVILTALQDSDEWVRSETVTALGKVAGADMIPALEQVAATDPAIDNVDHSFWIRRLAAVAIADIRKRSQPLQ